MNVITLRKSFPIYLKLTPFMKNTKYRLLQELKIGLGINIKVGP